MGDVLICDDDPTIRRLLSRLLTQHGFACRTADTGEAALSAIAEHAHRLLLLDMELPGISGMDVLRAVVRQDIPLEVLILTSFRHDDLLYEAIVQGAAGYILKTTPPERLVAAVNDVLAGGTVLDPSLAGRFWQLLAAERGRQAHQFKLDADQLELLSIVARGLTNPEAASALGRSQRQIRGELSRIFAELGVKTRVEAAVVAVRHGLVEL